MIHFFRTRWLNVLFLVGIILTCAYFIYSTERYNSLVSFRSYKGSVYVLEKIHYDDSDSLKFNIYNSWRNWNLGSTCFSRNIASYPKGNISLYNWGIERASTESVTLTNNGRALIFSVTSC